MQHIWNQEISGINSMLANFTRNMYQDTSAYNDNLILCLLICYTCKMEL